MLFEGIDDALFVIRSKCFQCDLQLYGCIAVRAYKLIVIQFDDISLFICNNGCHTNQLSCFVRKQNRDIKPSFGKKCLIEKAEEINLADYEAEQIR